MADATVNEVLNDAREMLGDPNAEEFTDGKLLTWYGFAYREMQGLFLRWGLPVAERDAYATLPAYTNRLDPRQVGITDLSEPVRVWERGGLRKIAITGVTNATPMVVTAASHGLPSNVEATVDGVVDPVTANGNWFTTATGDNTLSLNGSHAGGAYSSGGTVTFSTEEFKELAPVREIDRNATPSTRLLNWQWENGVFRFRGATSERQLWIEYRASGEPPAYGAIGIDNCRNFLSLRTASLAAVSRDMKERANDLKYQALGASLEADGTGGALRALVLPMLKELQKRPIRPGTFRPRRLTRW